MVRIYLVPNTSLTKTYKPSISTNLWYVYSVTLFDNMGTFHILTCVIFLRSDIYQNVFSYSKTGPGPV